MKILFIIIVLVLSFSCNKETCDLGDKYAKKYSKGIAERWQCNESLVYKDMASMLNKTVCKGNELLTALTIQGDVAAMACRAVVAGIAELGSDYLKNTWQCNQELVKADISKLNSGCSLLGLL